MTGKSSVQVWVVGVAVLVASEVSAVGATPPKVVVKVEVQYQKADEMPRSALPVEPEIVEPVDGSV